MGGGDGQVGVGEHGQGDVPVPAVESSDLVLVQTDLVLGGLEAFLDRPAGTGHTYELVDRGSGGAVAQVVGQLGWVGDVAADG